MVESAQPHNAFLSQCLVIMLVGMAMTTMYTHTDCCMFYRALEKVPRKGKMFDPAEGGGHNLLEEMSLLELRQRLAYTQQRLLVSLSSGYWTCLWLYHLDFGINSSSDFAEVVQPVFSALVGSCCHAHTHVT